MGTMAKRRAAAAATVLFLILYMMQMLVTAAPAGATHIDSTGQVGSNCVEFQQGATGEQSPSDFLDVTISLDSWNEDGKGFTFTIAGLTGGQYVDISVKSGSEQSGGGVIEDGPYGNGTYTFSHTEQNAISHVRLCVFDSGVEETTTTVEETTTTSTSTTTTTVPPSTTTSTTTTTVPPSTTTTTTLPPEQPSATVTSECIPGGGTKITVDVENGAMVRIDGPGEDDPVFAADNSIVVEWPVGSYNWMAWAEQVEVVDKGSIEVVSCTTPPPPSSTTSTTTTTAAAVPVTITAACPTSGAAPAMTVNPAGGATVNLVDEGNGVFSWTAVAAEGYVIESGGTGTFDLTECADVLGTTIISTTSTTVEVQASTVAAVTASTLPFTGFEMERTLMLAVAALMVGAGLLLVSYGTPERKMSTIADRW